MFKNTGKTDAFILLSSTVLLSLFFFYTGTIFSGYHFTDDHEIIRINNDLNKSSLFSVINQWASNDLNIRFRPLFFVHRVILVKLFGLNFFAWSVYYVLLLISTFCLFYLALRKLKFSITASLLFPVLAIVGTQAENWWRLGTSENAGALFLAMSFYYLKTPEKNNKIHNIIFGLCLISSALFKESFIIIIPAMLFLKITLYKQTHQTTIKKTISEHIFLLLPLACSILFLYIIYFHIGSNSIGYAGLESGTKLMDLLQQIRTIFKEELYYYWLLMVAAIIFTLFSLANDRDLFQYSRKLASLLLFIILFLTPLLILYAKSGMKDRYMIPASIGIAYFCATLFNETGSKISWQNVCLFLIFGWVVYTQYQKADTEARKFAKEGKRVYDLIQSIITRANKDSYVVLAFDPVASNEAAFSLKTYLESGHPIQLHAVFIDRNSIHSSASLSKTLFSNAQLWFSGRMYDPSKNKAPDILIFLNKGLRIYFFDESGVNNKNYNTTLSPESTYCIYYK